MPKLVIKYGSKESTTVSDAYIWPEHNNINYVPKQNKEIAVKRSKKGIEGQK